MSPGMTAREVQSRAIRQMFARADREPMDPIGFEARLMAVFGVEVMSDQDWPVAPVTRLADMGVADQDWWIRADPVYLEPRRDSLVLQSGLKLRQDDADRLVAELNAAMNGEGWRIKAASPERWYLKPPNAPEIRTTPLRAARGRDVHDLLPRGPDWKTWHTRLSEFQILMHTSPVNAEREANGLLPANSVWFWGGGRLPAPKPDQWARIWTEDPLGLGLARLAGIPVSSGQPDMGVWKSVASGQFLIIAPEDPLSPGGRGSESKPPVWEQWLEDLLQAVHGGNVDSLTLIPDEGPIYHYRRPYRWRFWRRIAQPDSRRHAA